MSFAVVSPLTECQPRIMLSCRRARFHWRFEAPADAVVTSEKDVRALDG